MRKLKYVAVAVAVATVAAAVIVSGPAGAQAKKKKTTVYCIGAYETKGDSAQAIPNFDDGAKFAVTELAKKGVEVKYERIPASGTIASSQEAAFLAAQTKNPDCWIGLTSSSVFITVGPKVAATDLPTFALASPSEGVKNGPSGGDNVFLLRPLNEQTYAQLLDYACTVLKAKKIGLNLVNTAFGTTVDQVVKNNIGKYKGCEVVSTQTNSAVATDMTQQALAFKTAGVDAIISANFPNPMGVFVNQLVQNGVNVPFLGGASLNIAKESGSIQPTPNLVVVDDCVPDLGKSKAEKKFTKGYQATFGYLPNYASAQVYDAINAMAGVVAENGHDYAKINKALGRLDYDGICDLQTDKNNVMARSVTIYKYNSDGTKKLIKTIPLEFVPPDDIATTLPPTTAKPAGT